MNKTATDNHYLFKFLGQKLHLLPEKAIFWEDQRALIISDLHMGKAGHFRKAGIPIPTALHIKELFVLDALIESYSPKQVLFLGDLFHSDLNSEWDTFTNWANHYTQLDLILVKGNHDILPSGSYINSNLQLKNKLMTGPFLFSHKREDEKGLYNISGHIHPAIKLRGLARQGLRLPCFYFGENHGIMPAFGNFTGTAKISVQKNDKVFVIAEQQVLPIPTG